MGQEADEGGERGQCKSQEGLCCHFIGAVGNQFESDDFFFCVVNNLCFEASISVLHHICCHIRMDVRL